MDEIKMKNKNKNNLFILTIKDGIKINYFTLPENLNKLLKYS